jgi:large subunit ribosomal protein L4
MPELNVYNLNHEVVGTVNVSEAVAGAPINVTLVHQVVVANLAGRRQGTRKTKGRGEVRGGGRKPFRQKGLGRSRHGSRREPQWVGGGTVHGPQPQDFHQRTPRRMRQAAWRAAFASKLSADAVSVVDDLNLTEYDTKRVVEVLRAFDAADQKVLILTPSPNAFLVKSAANLPRVRVQDVKFTDVVDLLRADRVLMTRDALPEIERKGAA